ncbi:hypothetical protein J3R30DRAFT_3414425 [Lentinula aciculospora]|uniref:Uncharacterized protein n=1 Tax=Lentinula aciculospora TaxID=153920 RepID=A0A9W8ZSH0_9AGAR|nr:hypothetical protein J3R30DRAFT_3414425 [Lentinula aciculospora]
MSDINNRISKVVTKLTNTAIDIQYGGTLSTEEYRGIDKALELANLTTTYQVFLRNIAQKLGSLGLIWCAIGLSKSGVAALPKRLTVQRSTYPMPHSSYPTTQPINVVRELATSAEDRNQSLDGTWSPLSFAAAVSSSNRAKSAAGIDMLIPVPDHDSGFALTATSTLEVEAELAFQTSLPDSCAITDEEVRMVLDKDSGIGMINLFTPNSEETKPFIDLNL